MRVRVERSEDWLRWALMRWSVGNKQHCRCQRSVSESAAPRGLLNRALEKKLAGRKTPRLHLRPRSLMAGITGTFKAVKRALKAATAIHT